MIPKHPRTQCPNCEEALKPEHPSWCFQCGWDEHREITGNRDYGYVLKAASDYYQFSFGLKDGSTLHINGTISLDKGGFWVNPTEIEKITGPLSTILSVYGGLANIRPLWVAYDAIAWSTETES